MRSLAGPLALLIVVASPVAALGAITAASQWARWILRAGGIVGVVGLVLTAAAVVNVLVPRTCATTADQREVNRPVLSVAVDDGDCFRSGLGQLELAGLVGVATSAVVALRLRRSAPGAGGGAPFAPIR